MTTSVPDYVAGVDLNGPARADALAVMDRLVDLYRAGSTDQVDSQWIEPVDNYGDPAVFDRERELVFRRLPIPVALSCELVGPNTHKAVEVIGTPIVVTRDAQGHVHAMLNVCRHRGALICAEGVGKGRRLTCPYHAWSYELDGRLAAIYGASTFGDLDMEERSLVTLTCEERHGIIFVGLTPGLTWDLDVWLAEVTPILESLHLEDCFHFSTRTLHGPNWKIAVDGYLEGYHFQSLHRDTVFKTNMSNIAAFDPLGAHLRNSFGLKALVQAADEPRESWDPATNVGPIVWLFPGLAIAGGWRDRMAVSIVLPGQTVGTSATQQMLLLRKPPVDDAAEHEAAFARDWFYDVTLGEDYMTGFGIQRGLSDLAGKTMIFGRNEPGVQHFHRTLDALVASGGAWPA